MRSFSAYEVGIVHASVCADNNLPIAEVTKMLNKEYPTGISSPWEHSPEKFEDGSPNPNPCNEYPGERTHYLFNC
jgi:hypothetical protein